MRAPSRIGVHFRPAELTVTDQPLPNEPGLDEWCALAVLTTVILDPLRRLIGQPISVNSGFRSAAVNAAVGGSSTSDHMRGMAADIVVGPRRREWVEGWTPARLAAAIVAADLPFDQVIFEPSWVHVSHRLGAVQRGQVLRATGGGYVPWTPPETP